MLKTNGYSAASVVRSHIDMIDQSLESMIDTTIIDYKKAFAMRVRLDNMISELKGIWNDIHSDACGARNALLSAEVKASKLHEAIMAATSTTFDNECNIRWLGKLYELGLRG